MAELMPNIFASSIIHSAAFPQYPLGSVRQTIRFHLGHSTVLSDYLFESFDRFPLSGLTLLAFLHEGRPATERALEALIIAEGSDTQEKERREDLLRHYRSVGDMDPLDLAPLTLQRIRAERPGTGGLAVTALTQAR